MTIKSQDPHFLLTQFTQIRQYSISESQERLSWCDTCHVTRHCSMHTATRGPGRRKQHYSQATFNMHMEVSHTKSLSHKLFVICQLSVLWLSVLNQCHVPKENWSSSLIQTDLFLMERCLGINEAFSLFMLILEKGIWKGNTTINHILSTWLGLGLFTHL